MTSWMSLKSLPPLKYDEPYPLFNRISIETVGRCTRECVFCPSRMRTPEQRGTMSDEVFDTLMKQFSELKFDGVMQLFYLGEPLLDKKIAERVGKAREACPKAKLLLTSNGDLLKKSEQVDELFDEGLNILNVDCYEQKVYDQVGDALAGVSLDVEVQYGKVKWRGVGHRSKLVNVADLSNTERYYHNFCHSYLIPEIEQVLRDNEMLATKKQRFCAQPHRKLVIWWTGEITTCCVSTPMFKKAIVVGDYRDILGAWNSLEMAKYRWWLQQGLKLGICKDCYYKHAFPHVVRRITKPPNI